MAMPHSSPLCTPWEHSTGNTEGKALPQCSLFPMEKKKCHWIEHKSEQNFCSWFCQPRWRRRTVPTQQLEKK